MAGYINKQFIEDLLSKVDIIDIISDYTELKKRGAYFFGLSPFQNENSPSFCVKPATQRFTCYSSSKTGNVVTFLMEHENLTYTEAIEQIAKKISVEIEYDNTEQTEAYKQIAEKKKEYRPVLEKAFLAYQNHFKTLKKDHHAKVEVLEHRQYTDNDIAEWGICYAPGSRFLFDLFTEPKDKEAAQEIGLIGEKADKLWDRVLYPINNTEGFLIGFGARDLSGKKNSAKWMNPPQSILYQKDKIWFALDRAKKSIINQQEAWVVEGYNDVIAWHKGGITNTIASCGTAITENQIKILRKYTDKINFTFDNDKAGNKAMLRYIPLFLEAGFCVKVVTLKGFDPDDFLREHQPFINEYTKKVETVLQDLKDNELSFDEIANKHEMSEDEVAEIGNIRAEQTDRYVLENIIKANATTTDGFKTLMDAELVGDAIDITKAAQRLADTLSKIQDDALTEIYIPWLVKESKVSKTSINKWIKHFKAKREAARILEEEKKRKAAEAKEDNSEEYQYDLPEEVKIPFKELKDDIFKYQMFMANDKVWMQVTNDGYKTFRSVTNFSIQILQHMQDEKFPMKLLKIKNIHGLQKIFDVPSENLNTPQKFDDSVTAHGNFQWTAGRNDFIKLRSYLFDKMGNGRKIDVLGWQKENFWAWNNLIILEDGSSYDIDENGIFIHKDISYYLPSANKIYASNQFKFEAQKKFKVQKASVSFQSYVVAARKVHREHAISGLLFSIASMFQDVVVDYLGNFPILFLYGPPSTGKDQLAEICQSFYGIPQTAINLEGGVSTIKAQVREFAQFCNSMSHLSEYKRGDPKLDGVLKGLWDRRGYKRGNIESHVGTESIPILSSVILTGNDYPDAEALITRLIPNEMTKNTFNELEVKEFEKLREMTKGGISSYTKEILQHRELFIKNFEQKYKMFKSSFREVVPEAKSRMISNIAVLGATYEVFKDVLQIPFSFIEMTDHFVKITKKQSRRLESASIINKFWDTYLAALRGPITDRLQVGVDLKIEGESLFFNFTNTFNKIQTQWFKQHRESAPGKGDLKDKLKKENCFVTYHERGVRMASGKACSPTSAFEINLSTLSLRDEILNAIEYQQSQGKAAFDVPNSPATPHEHEILKEDSSEMELPFQKK